MDYWVSLFQCYGTEYSLSVPLMTYLAFSTILDIDNHRTDGGKRPYQTAMMLVYAEMVTFG